MTKNLSDDEPEKKKKKKWGGLDRQSLRLTKTQS